MTNHASTSVASTGLKEILSTLFANYDMPFGQGGEGTKAKVQAYLWACEGKSLDLVNRVVRDFVTGAVDRPANRRSKLPTAEEFAGQIKVRAAGDDDCVAAAKTHSPPFGPLWSVLLYARLLAGPDKDMPAPSRFVASQIANGGAIGERYRLDHQANNGFRSATFMLLNAADAMGCSVDEKLKVHVALFEPVPVTSQVFEQWKQLHADRGWPWLPNPGKQRVVYLPSGGAAGLGALADALAGEAARVLPTAKPNAGRRSPAPLQSDTETEA